MMARIDGIVKMADEKERQDAFRSLKAETEELDGIHHLPEDRPGMGVQRSGAQRARGRCMGLMKGRGAE